MNGKSKHFLFLELLLCARKHSDGHPTTLWYKRHYSYFKDEKIEAQVDQMQTRTLWLHSPCSYHHHTPLKPLHLPRFPNLDSWGSSYHLPLRGLMPGEECKRKYVYRVTCQVKEHLYWNQQHLPGKVPELGGLGLQPCLVLSPSSLLTPYLCSSCSFFPARMPRLLEGMRSRYTEERR